MNGVLKNIQTEEVHKMSCFIMSEHSQSSLADTLEYVLNSGFDRFGFEAPDSLHKALADCATAMAITTPARSSAACMT